MTDEEWEARGNTPMCAQCSAAPPDDRACPFWLRRQPCPVEIGMSET